MSRRLVLALLLTPATVLAEPASSAPADTADPEHGPGFVNLQRFDATSRAGIELTMTKGPAIRRWDLHAQYVHPAYRVGGYVRLPYSSETYQNDDPPVELSRSMVGNFAFGGLWVPHLEQEHVAVVVHAGLAVPIDSDENLTDVASIASLMRPHELYSTLTNATTGGAGASLLARAGHAFARLDAGIETILAWKGPYEQQKPPAFHVNGGVGFDQGIVSAALEVSTLTIVTDQPFLFLFSHDTFESADVLSAVAFSIRYRRPHLQAYAAIANPMRDQQTRYYGSAFTFGIEGSLR